MITKFDAAAKQIEEILTNLENDLLNDEYFKHFELTYELKKAIAARIEKIKKA